MSSRRDFSAAAGSAVAFCGDLVGLAPTLFFLLSRRARPRKSLWVLGGPLATASSVPRVWRGGAGSFSGHEDGAELGRGSFIV